MRIYRLAVCFYAALMVLGCATSPESLREDASARRQLVVRANYQQVLKNLVEQYQNCAAAPLLPLGQVINDVNHYPDLRRASIVRGAMGIGRQINLVIDLSEASAGVTVLDVWAPIALDKYTRQIQRIAAGDLGCSFP